MEDATGVRSAEKQRRSNVRRLTCSDTLSPPSGPGEEDWMTFTVKLEQADGTPADPPTLRTAVPNWSPRDTIFLGRRSFAWSQFEAHH
jgi:hypothetical protein